MANRTLFMPTTGKASTLGKTNFDDGQFKNPPAYLNMGTGGFTGPGKIVDPDGSVMALEKSVSVRSGRV